MITVLRRLFTRPAVAAAPRPSARIQRERPRLLFSFHGGNKVWPGIGQQLYRKEAAFRESVGRLSPAAERSLDFSLSEFFAGREVSPAVSPEENEQRQIVILCAAGIALHDLCHSYGVEPDAVIGNCGGEIGAAYAAGALTAEDASEVACSVARLVTRKPSQGHFIWLGVGYDQALRLSRRSAARFEIAIDLSPVASMAYCASDEFGGVQSFLSESGVSHRTAETGWAYHTPDFNALREMEGELYQPPPRPLRLLFYSSVAGGLLPPGTLLGAEHCYRAAVEPVMFGRALCAALTDGYGVTLNLCGNAWFKSAMEESAEELHKRPLILDAVRRGEQDLTTWGETHRRLTECGCVGPRAEGVARGAAPMAAAADSVNLLSPEVVRDPYPHYAALRRSGSVHYLKRHGFWLVLGYADVVYALKHTETFSSVRPGVSFDPVLAESDPPAHTRVRRILSPYFSAQAAQALEDYVRDCAAKLMREAGRPEEFDLVAGFAHPLADLAVARLLGLSEEDANSLRRRLAPHRWGGPLFQSLEGWLREHVARLLAHPDESLGGRLLRGEGEEALAPEEVVTLLKLLWGAGTQTTERLIAASALALLRHPTVRDEVQGDLSLLPAFVEEVLRLDTPELMAWRSTRAEVELSGVKIPAGAEVKLCLAAANHDPAHFPEPESLSLRRSPNNHLSFGAGPHYCLGAALARMETRVALDVLLDEWPDFRAARPLHTLSYFAEYHARTLRELFVAAE